MTTIDWKSVLKAFQIRRDVFHEYIKDDHDIHCLQANPLHLGPCTFMFEGQDGDGDNVFCVCGLFMDLHSNYLNLDIGSTNEIDENTQDVKKSLVDASYTTWRRIMDSNGIDVHWGIEEDYIESIMEILNDVMKN